MRILILADIDELHWPAGGGKADLLLSCGDLFDQVIVEAAQAYHCPQIFAVKATTIRTAPSCRRSRISICGCATIERVKPKLVVHGHQRLNNEARLGSTRIVGVHGHRMLEI